MILKASEEEINNRLDLTLMREYKENPSKIRLARDRYIKTWKDDSDINRLIPSKQSKLSKFGKIDDERAVRSIVDYWFEAEMFTTMSVGQARDYMLASQKTISFSVEGDIPQSGMQPILIETLHHRLCFSVIYSVVNNLLVDFNYRKFILLHMNSPLESRLGAINAILKNSPNAEPVSIQIKGEWIKELSNQITNDSVVIYMGDMSTAILEKSHQPRKANNYLHLFADKGCYVDSLSIARILARRLSAKHLMLDYPEKDVTCLRAWSKNSPLRCPLVEWIFWPAFQQLYDVKPLPIKTVDHL